MFNSTPVVQPVSEAWYVPSGSFSCAISDVDMIIHIGTFMPVP